MKKSFKGPGKAFPLYLILALLVTCLAACVKNNTPAATTGAASFLQVVNASQASVPQDFYFADAKTSYTLGYGQTTGFQPLTPGTDDVAFNTSSTSNLTASTTITFGAGYNTVYLTDDKSIVGFLEDRTAPQSGNARISFVQLSSAYANTPVDIYITGGSAMVSGLYNKTASAYYDVAASTTSFSLTASGSSTVLLNMPVTLSANHLYTIYISGVPSKPLDYHLLQEN